MGGSILHSTHTGQVHLQLENLTSCSVSSMRSVDHIHMVSDPGMGLPISVDTHA